MKEETGYFTSFDGVKLFYRIWEKETSDVFFIVHGFGEHSGRYANLIETLRDLPISIVLFDLRGHGRSEGERVCVESFHQFVDDVFCFRTFVEARKPGLPRNFILYGQSFGGLVAAASVLKQQNAWKALVLLAPFFRLPFGHWLLAWLTACLNCFVPKHVWSNPVKPIFLTRDLKELEQYKRDPFIQRRIGICLAYEMFQGGKCVEARAKEITLPLLVLGAGDDRIVSTPRIKRFFERAASQEKEIHVFDGFYHELFHEIGREKPLGVLKEFVRKHISGR
jgi:alpha-beta hydrolase superfamily lysophospholipase